MSDYTPTTEDVRQAYVIDPENPFFNTTAEMRFGEEFDRWIAEVKAETWEEGALWHRAHGEDRRMKVRFLHDLELSNPYRQGREQ